MRNFENNLQQTQTLMGEEAAYVEMKSCLRPNEMTEEELAVAAAVMSWRIERVWAVIYTERVAAIGTPAYDIAKSRLRRYLGYPLGMWAYENRNNNWSPEMAAMADEIIKENSVVPCTQHWGPLTKALKDGQFRQVQ